MGEEELSETNLLTLIDKVVIIKYWITRKHNMINLAKYIILISTILLSFVAAGQNLSLSGHWTLVCFSDILSRTQECDSLFKKNSLISVEFKDNGVNGTIIANLMYRQKGVYKLFDYNKITVECFGTYKGGTLRTWQSRCYDALCAASSFEYVSDTLIIYYDEGERAMKFARTDNYVTLKGNWTLSAYIDIVQGKEQIKASSKVYTPISIEFNDYNRYGRIYTLKKEDMAEYELGDSNSLSVNDWGRRYGDTKSEQNEEFWKSLFQATSYKYEHGILVIYYENGSKAMKFIRTSFN